MYCRGCEYDLANLRGRKCPECGRAFNPYDPSTFDLKPRRERWLELALIVAGSVPLLANVSAYAALIGARLLLGRWPLQYGADPKGIDGIGLLYSGAMLLLVASLPAMVAGTWLVAVLGAKRATPRAIRGGAIAACLWLVGFGLAWWDPAKAWFWLFD